MEIKKQTALQIHDHHQKWVFNGPVNDGAAITSPPNLPGLPKMMNFPSWGVYTNNSFQIYFAELWFSNSSSKSPRKKIRSLVVDDKGIFESKGHTRYSGLVLYGKKFIDLWEFVFCGTDFMGSDQTAIWTRIEAFIQKIQVRLKMRSEGKIKKVGRWCERFDQVLSGLTSMPINII